MPDDKLIDFFSFSLLTHFPHLKIVSLLFYSLILCPQAQTWPWADLRRAKHVSSALSLLTAYSSVPTPSLRALSPPKLFPT